jgi:iron complex outermembrane receptor protein
LKNSEHLRHWLESSTDASGINSAFYNQRYREVICLPSPIRVLLAGLCSALVLIGAPAVAQSADATTQPTSTDQLEAIIVNAQRRQQNLQDVPVAVNAFSASEIANSVISSDTDLGMVTPGLVSAAQFGYFQPHLRGVGTTAPSSSVESPVAVYVDGVYYGAQTGSIFALAGIDRIEVDKGPQGTLFGRNATGGLIQIITKDPEQKFSGTASVTAGDYTTLGSSLYVTGGITPTIAANLSAYVQNQSQGYGKNYFTGEDVNRAQDLAIRQKTLFTPSDNDKVLLTFDYEQDHSSPVFIPAPGTKPLGGPPYTGPRQGANGYYQPLNFERQGGVSLKIDHDFGFASFESLSSYLKSSLYSSFDGTLFVDPTYLLNIALWDLHNQYSQEFALRSEANSSITWATGLYLYHSYSQYDPVTLTGGLIAPLTSYVTYSNASGNSGALYAQGSKEIFDATTLTLGARYTVEKKHFSESQYGVYPGSAPTLFGSVDNATQRYERPTWRISLDRKLAADALVYASYNRGFKSGGFNDQLLPVQAYAPETLDAYEIGEKAAFLDRRIQLDTSVFYYNYNNIQVVSYPGGTEVIYNGAKAHIYGLDLDFKAIPFSNFTLSAGLEWLHATFSSFPVAQLSTPAPGGGTNFSTFNATGRRLPLAPDWTFDISPTYSIPLSDLGEIVLSATVSYTAGFNFEPDNRLYQPAYTLVNASAAWDAPAKDWNVRLWAKNLTNKAYTTAEYSQSNGDYAIYAPPRTYGITVSRRF